MFRLSRSQISGSNFSYQHHTFERCLDDFAGLAEASYAGDMTFELFGNGSYSLDPAASLGWCLDAFEKALPG